MQIMWILFELDNKNGILFDWYHSRVGVAASKLKDFGREVLGLGSCFVEDH